MWRIIRFLGRFGNLILVLFLELVALLIVITVNKPQREISQGVFSEFSGTFSKVQSSVSGYFNLDTENEKLMEQNARLEQDILSLRDSLHAYRYRLLPGIEFLSKRDSATLAALGVDPKLLTPEMVPDTTADGRDTLVEIRIPVDQLPVGGYGFLPARAINNSVNLNYNYITLDKGSRNGVEMDMGVISPEGVAGQVVGVSQNFSLVMSVLNKKFRSSVRLSGNSNMGVLSWDGDDAGLAKLEFIPQTSTIRKGDTVETTGFSTVFPPNYMVGTVAEFNKEDQDGFYNITVELSANFRTLDNLFLVRHAYKKEIDELESEKATQ